jgi:hypothetical protein
MTCEDDATELCVYEERSPWLLATSLGSLVALPTNELGFGQVFTLADNPGAGWLEGFRTIFWSPDGRVAIFGVREEQLGASFHYARFGAGLPSPVGLVPDVPNFITYAPKEPEFSADSRYAFIYDDVTGTYLVDWKDTTARARHIPPTESGAPVQTTFCSDGSWFAWVDMIGQDQTWLGQLDPQGSITHTELDSIFAFTVSNDRRLLVLDRGSDDEGNALGAVLRPCSSEQWSVALPAASYYVFSPDSKRLWLETFDGVQKVLSLDEPSSPVELLSSDSLGATLLHEFSPDGNYVEASVDGVAYLASLSQPSSQPLVPLPDTATVAVLGHAALLAWSSDPAKSEQLFWHAVPPNGPPVPLLENVTPDNLSFIADALDPERVFLVRMTTETSELFSVLLDGSLPEATPLLEIEGAVDTVMSTPDRTGVLLTRDRFEPEATLLLARFEPSGALGTPSLVVEGPGAYEIQPWP